MSLKMFEIDDDYILKLKSVDDKVADPKTDSRTYPRKYLGILFETNVLFSMSLTPYPQPTTSPS